MDEPMTIRRSQFRQVHGSLHTSLGWRGQLDRVRRWHKRVREIGWEPGFSGGTVDNLDVLFAFFQNCYHLRDWLERSRTMSKQQLDNFFQEHEEMQICRDICNGTKHLEISKPSVDADFSIGREYEPGYRPCLDESYFVIAYGDMHDLFDLADSCMRLWESFLTRNGLA